MTQPRHPSLPPESEVTGPLTTGRVPHGPRPLRTIRERRVGDASVVLASSSGRRSLRWDEFLLGPKRTARRPGELILGVELPDQVPARQAFAKIGVRQAMVIATVSCCVTRFDDGEIRVALGAVGPTVLRARHAEAFLSDHPDRSDDDLAGFARIVASEVQPITDHRSTEAYRRHAAGVLARRTLERVA